MLSARGLGEIYVMVLIAMILIIALFIVYEFTTSYTRYLANENAKIAQLESSQVSMAPVAAWHIGNYYVIKASILGSIPLTNKAPCTYTMLNGTTYVTTCNVATGPGMVNISIYTPWLLGLDNFEPGYLLVSIPTPSGVVARLNIYVGPLPASAIYSQGSTIVTVVNNSTGWVIINNTIVPPGGSASFTINSYESPISIIEDGGAYNITIPTVLLATTTALAPPIPPTCSKYRIYYDNGGLSGFSSITYGTDMSVYMGYYVADNIQGAVKPIHLAATSVVNAFFTTQSYSIALMQVSTSISIGSLSYGKFSVDIYPTLYVPNETAYILYVVVSLPNGNPKYVYYVLDDFNSQPLNSQSPGSGASNYIAEVLSSLTGVSTNKVKMINETIISENSWQVLEGSLPNPKGQSLYISSVGFGIVFVNNGPEVSGFSLYSAAYFDYLCIG